MVLDTTETRLNRAEGDIETLRTTQTNILNHLDGYSKTLNETRGEGAACDQDPQVDPVIASMDRTIATMDRSIARMKRMTAQMDRIIQIARENHAMLLENRAILLALAEHWGVTIEERDSSR
ncbi:MAG: hypothetical protein F4X02_14725 [Chloroflexi bacterium]|nr:hypothetical protein [Chloroflexota bacterium]